MCASWNPLLFPFLRLLLDEGGMFHESLHYLAPHGQVGFLRFGFVFFLYRNSGQAKLGKGFSLWFFFTCFHVGLGASPRHNLPAALILEDDFDLQPDFAPLASQSGEEAWFFLEPANLSIEDAEFCCFRNCWKIYVFLNKFPICQVVFLDMIFLRFEARWCGEDVCFDWSNSWNFRGLPLGPAAKVKVGRIFGGGQVFLTNFPGKNGSFPPGKVPWNPEKSGKI